MTPDELADKARRDRIMISALLDGAEAAINEEDRDRQIILEDLIRDIRTTLGL